MIPQSNSHLVSSFKAFSRAAGVMTILAGGLVLLGWMLDITGAGFWLTLFAVLNVSVLMALIWWNTRSLERADTNRKPAEEALRASERRLADVLDIAGAAVISLDEVQRIRRFDPRAEKIFGFTGEEVLGRPLDMLLPSRFVEAHRRHIGDFAAAPETAQRMGDQRGIFGRRKDGTEFPMEAAISKFSQNGQVTFTVVLRDITERKKAEEALGDYAERLQSLSVRLVEVQEAERRRIARELHDEIGQALTAVKIQLQALQRQPRGAPPRLEECVRIVDSALSQVHNLSLDLRPPQLDDLGLPAALRWYVDRQAHAAKLTPSITIAPLPARLHPDLEIACFRVAQETLTNVMRHARAHQVWVELRQHGDELRLVIRDDGLGFDVAAAQERALKGDCMGLLGMRERVELAGGRLELKSAPGQGTVVHAAFPLVYTLARTRLKQRKP